jgi:hypothetical protein
MCLAAVQSWIKESQINGKVAYFFESGHENQIDANKIMKRIFDDSTLRQSYRYVAHAFVQKEEIRPVQAADILAWLHRNYVIRAFKGNNIARKDYLSLIELPHKAVHIDELNFQQLVQYFGGVPALAISGKATGYFLPMMTLWWN